jgi:excisionase family DNA binding protein
MLELLNKKQAATELGVSTVTLDRLRKSGRLQFRKIGSQIRFLPEDLDAFIANSLTTETPRRLA